MSKPPDTYTRASRLGVHGSNRGSFLRSTAEQYRAITPTPLPGTGRVRGVPCRSFWRIFLGVLLVLAAQPGSAQSPQQLFDQANQLYAKHVYDSAAALYQKLIARGYRSAALFYNAGNASLMDRQLGYAVYYFEKAHQEAPGNASIQHNLSLATQKATGKISQEPTLFFIRWWHGWLHWHRANIWAAGSLLFFWIFLGFLGWRLARRPAPRWTRWALAAAALLCIGYGCGAAGSWYYRTHHRFAILVVKDQPLKSAPDAQSPDILVLPEGQKVRITDAVNGWEKVELTDGQQGWLDSSGMLPL